MDDDICKKRIKDLAEMPMDEAAKKTIGELETFTNDMKVWLKNICEKRKLNESAIPSVLLNMYGELLGPEIEKSMRTMGASRAVDYLNVQTQHVLYVAKELEEMHTQVKEWIDKQNG